MRGALVAALGVALAGCLAAPVPEIRAGDVAADLPLDFAGLVEPDHRDHGARDAHAKDGLGLALVGHSGLDPLVEAGSPASITSLDVAHGWAAVAGFDGGLAFAIFDVRDPARPVAVSRVEMRGQGWGVRFSDDAQYLFYTCTLVVQYAVPRRIEAPVPGECERAGGPGLPLPASSLVIAYDVRDKAAPRAVASVASRGTHNLQTASVDGADVVVTDAVEVLRFDRATASFETLSEVPGRHDATLQRHPATGEWTLYTGTGGGGFAIYDASDLRRPRPLFVGELEGVVGWHEQTPVPGLVEGRALLALAGESVHASSGLADHVSVVDVTDPTRPAALGTWAPPFTPARPWTQYSFSAHEMAATPSGKLAVAWYHAGVWVLDLSTLEGAREPAAVAAYLPHEPSAVTPTRFALVPVPTYPNVWGAAWDARGYLLVPDMHSGLYVLEPPWGLEEGIDGGQ